MVDPKKLTKYGRMDGELQEVILFGILAAGKMGVVAARQLEALLTEVRRDVLPNGDPFDVIRELDLDDIRRRMKRNGIGCQKVKGRGFYEIVRADLDLRTCTTRDLERVHSIGLKTSRLFTLHTRRGCEDVPLDTHNLAELRELGYPDIPAATPSSLRKYQRIEGYCREEAKKACVSVAEWDLAVWLKRQVSVEEAA